MKARRKTAKRGAVRREKAPPWTLQEARALYRVEAADAEPEEDGEDLGMWATTRLSSKNQITLPVKMVRALGLRPGDEIDLIRVGDELILDRRPQGAKEWVAKTMGSLAHIPEWQTKEGIDAYVKRERDSWDRDWEHDETS